MVEHREAGTEAELTSLAAVSLGPEGQAEVHQKGYVSMGVRMESVCFYVMGKTPLSSRLYRYEYTHRLLQK